MLVLSRKVSEGIVIKKEITIEILGVRGTQVKLGIQAPRNISILRAELQKIKPS